MEISGKKLLDLPVFAVDNGQKLGQVKDYVFDPAARALVALVVGVKGMFREDLLLPLAHIKHIGGEAVTVDSVRSLSQRDGCPQWSALLKSPPDLIALPLMTEAGAFLGKSSSFRFEAQSGQITALEAGDRRHKTVVKAEDVLVYGSDVILVKTTASAAAAPEQSAAPRRRSAAGPVQALKEAVKSKRGDHDRRAEELMERICVPITPPKEETADAPAETAPVTLSIPPAEPTDEPTPPTTARTGIHYK